MFFPENRGIKISVIKVHFLVPVFYHGNISLSIHMSHKTTAVSHTFTAMLTAISCAIKDHSKDHPKARD